MADIKSVPAFVPAGQDIYREVRIDYTNGGRVARITMDTTGKKLNPLTCDITNEMMAAIVEVRAREDLHVVILRGAGG